MSNRFRLPPVDTDRRQFFRGMAPGAERGGRMFRGPHPGTRPWTARPSPRRTSHGPPSHGPPSHGPPSHGPPSHGPPSHGPPSHGPPSHGPPSHGHPSAHDWPPHHPPADDWPPYPPAQSDWPVHPPAASHASAAEGALTVLSSCGLDANDLSALAELPEDLLTLKSLPLLLKQIKGLKKDPGVPGYLPSGHTSIPHFDQSEAVYPGPAPRQEMDQSLSLYRDPGPSKADFPAAAPGGSSFVVEYGHCAAAQDSHKSPERSRRSSPGFTSRGSQEFRRSIERTPLLGAITVPSIPSETEARDFHGMKPPAFPYSCSLCDITVLSDFVWTQHVTSTLHADSQLALLQRYPSWDCRLASVLQNNPVSKEPVETAKKPAKKTKKDSTTTNSKKTAKVVCVKFPAKTVDESYLRKLLSDIGKIVHVAMFPSLGFIELETPEQAQYVIDFYTKTPHKVKDQEIEFTLSTTFNFLQSSFVLNFHPVPFGRDSQSDLLTIIKRFGTPRYTMFIPKRMEGFVEMQNAADAHKMVEFYSESPLKMNGVDIKVSFSQEFRTLERCVTARPYDKEQLKKSEGEDPNQSKKKPDKSRASVSPAKERRHSQGKSEGKSPARSVGSVSSDRPKTERSSASRDREAEAKQTEDAQKAPSQLGEDSDIEGMQVVGEQLDDETPDLPPDLRYCITLDEVSDSEEAEEEEEEEDEDSPRVVYIGNLPLCKYSDPQFIKLVMQVHRPVRYFINRQQRMGLVEFNNRREARNFVGQMQNHNFGGSSLDVFISNKYNRLPWGRGVEYDESGRIMRHFRVGNSPKRDGFFHSQLEGNRAKHKNPQIAITRSPQRSRRRSGDRARGRSRGRSRGKSRGRSRDRSKDRHSPKSAEKSTESDKKDVREKSKSPAPQEKPPPVDESQAAPEDSATAGADKEGWVVHQDMGDHEDGEGQTLKIENVVSLNTESQGAQGQESTGNTGRQNVSKDQDSEVMGAAEKSAEECDEQADESRTEGGKTAKRKGDQDTGEEPGPGPEKRPKQEDQQDSMTTEGGAAAMREPSKPVGSEFIVFYCDLCHVKCSDEQEARVSHCSSREHYLKYQEVTGKDPWSV